MKNKNILITGGKGFIGSYLVETLSKDNNVKVFDIQDGKDIKDFELLKRELKNVDVVFHLAGLISVEESMRKPLDYIENNIIGSYNLLKSASETGVKKIVFASSASVYGDYPENPKKEDMPLIPKSPYAFAKITVERLVDKFNGNELKTVSLRFFNIYGPGQNVNSAYAAVIPIFIKKALNNEDLIIYGDGNQTRDFIYIDDVINACVLASEKGSGAINIGSGIPISVNEIAKLIIELTNSKSKIRHIENRSGDITHSLSDISRAKDLLGFEPKYDIRTGLKKTIEWFKSE